MDTCQGQTTNVRYSHAQKRWEAIEPEFWVLRNLERLPVAFADAVLLCNAVSRRVPYYIAALLSGYYTDVPRIISGVPSIASFTADIPGETNDVGSLVLEVL